MPPAVSRKRTRSTHVSDSDDDPTPMTSTSTIDSSQSTRTTLPKRQRNANASSTTHTNYSLRHRSVTSDTPQIPSNDRSTTSQRYNLRPRTSQSQVRSSRSSTTIRRRLRHPNPPTITPRVVTPPERSVSPVSQTRQYRFVYISDDDDDDDNHTRPTTSTQSPPTITNTTFNLITDDEDEEPRRTQVPPRRTVRSTTTTRSRVISDPTSGSSSSSTTTTENPDYSTGAVAHIRLNRAIEIVFDSIQSLEGAVNNFDQLVFGLIYGPLSTRTEIDGTEGMIRLSRILNLNFPSRLSQDEIDALPQIKFLTKTEPTSSILLVEKCPICLTEFNDQEIINKLHCTHLFHLPCISTWLSENDSCPTCRRKVNGD